MNILVTDSATIRDAYIQNSQYTETTPGVYQSETDTLYFTHKIDTTFMRSVFSAAKQITARIISEEQSRSIILNPSAPEISIWCLVEGQAISTEHGEGDIILPNVFLQYNHEIDAVNFDKSNQDSFLHDPLFLTQYTQQTDVDFELFGLSIGGITVTKTDGLDSINKESVEFAYSADCIDSTLYSIVQESITQECSAQFFPLILVLESDTSAERKGQLAEHIPAVITYFGEDETGETSEEDEEFES